MKKSDVHMRLESVDVSERRIAQARNRTPVMQNLAHLVAAFSHHLEPLMRDGAQFTRMRFHPPVDGGIVRDGSIESQDFRPHPIYFYAAPLHL